MKRIFYAVVAIPTILFWSCRAQSERDTILQTSEQIIKAIRENNSGKIISLMYFEDLKGIKDSGMVEADVKDLNNLFSRYYGDKEPPVEITYLYNNSGQMLVKIPICDTFHDSVAINVNKIHLDLLFGPPNVFPLKKITDYEIITNMNDHDSTDFQPLSYWQERRGMTK